jgi:hypothetical protein
MHVNFLLPFGLNWSMGSRSLHAWQYRSFSTIFPFNSTYKESDVITEGFNEEVTLTAKLLTAIGPVILALHSIRLKYHLSDFFGAHGVLGDFSLVTSSLLKTKSQRRLTSSQKLQILAWQGASQHPKMCYLQCHLTSMWT